MPKAKQSRFQSNAIEFPKLVMVLYVIMELMDDELVTTDYYEEGDIL